jgi:hypothetical protein
LTIKAAITAACSDVRVIHLLMSPPRFDSITTVIERRRIRTMANDRPGLLQASSADWDKAWDVVSQLGIARKHLEHDTGVITGETPTARDSVAASVQAIETRPLHRSLAVWILIGALWVSIGMIVSAAIVTVAFLA